MIYRPWSRVALLASLATWVWAWTSADSARAEESFVAPWLTGQSAAEDIRVSLVTMGPGDEVHQYFGHTALEVRDRALGVEALYNFGMFEFDERFLVRFLKGDLDFWLGVQPTTLSYIFYAHQDRDVRFSELSLPPAEAAELARALAVQALPEHRRYRYHHYFDNCATRIVDALDRATHGAFKRSLQAPARMSLRDHTRRYMARNPVVDWLLVFLMNDSMERPILRQHELFLPDELERAVDRFRLRTGNVEVPLVARRSVFHRAHKVRKAYDRPPTSWPYTLAVGMAYGLALLLAAWSYAHLRARAGRVLLGLLTALFGLVFGALGLLLTSLALFTQHAVTYWNENLFFANPATLGLVPLGFALALGRPRAAPRLVGVWGALSAASVLGLALKVLPNFDQQNRMVWTLLLPATLCGLWAVLWAHRAQGPKPLPRSDEAPTQFGTLPAAPAETQPGCTD